MSSGSTTVLRSAPVPVASYELLDVARHGLSTAATAGSAPERYAAAHLAALRAAAAVLASRARPGSHRRATRRRSIRTGTSGQGSRRRLAKAGRGECVLTFSPRLRFIRIGRASRSTPPSD